ncbi:MAG: hypothetical protein M1821_004853 [Bathelium mastoideum]|nr:MAG: hypothetical protein M1821_004853 [Bathelium mastoideum]KAI9689100.1 MAG: hypothetical protein M1822_000838 [Bathelium mastoideum]
MTDDEDATLDTGTFIKALEYFRDNEWYPGDMIWYDGFITEETSIRDINLIQHKIIKRLKPSYAYEIDL